MIVKKFIAYKYVIHSRLKQARLTRGMPLGVKGFTCDP